MLNVPVYRLHVTMNARIGVSLVFVFLFSLFMPLASASGMQGCTINGGTCDSWDKSDDGTPNQQDWIVGIYQFDLVDTSTINMQMSWALHEFNRTSLGLDSAAINAAMAAEGMTADDGAPADLIRNYFDESTAGPGTPTVRDKLSSEVNDTIEELLSSGFGSVNSISTSYVNSISNSGQVTTCSDDPDMDTASEAGLENNVFDPPICFSVTASVSLSTSTFNFGGVDPLTLERVYQGMLVMGSDITSQFDIFSEPGHESVFVINPPDFATVKSVDPSGIRVIRAGPPSFMAAQWSIDNLDAPSTGQRISQTVSTEISYRNSSQTSSVEILPTDIGITLDVILDMTDESSTYIDIIAGINHLDDSTMSDWGISLVDVTDNAKIPWVTSDGIRLAYQNDLIELENFTDNFPMEIIGDAIESAVPAVGDVQISNPSWVSQSSLVGISGPSGGLNYTHTACPESLPPGVEAFYCVRGQNAMDGTHPVYLRSTSNAFNLNILDLIKQETEDPLIDVIQESDLRKLLDSGLSIETQFGQNLLQDMIPTSLPPSELTLEIVLPTWMQAATGDSSIKLVERSVGEDELSISIASPSPYDPRHAIVDGEGNQICSADEVDWTCVNSEIKFDFSKLNFNEWGPSIDITASFSSSLEFYRFKVPDEVSEIFESDNATISMEVIPSDLIRLGIDIFERMDNPPNETIDFSKIGLSETYFLEFSASGLTKFASDIGQGLTNKLHLWADDVSRQYDNLEVDMEGVQFITSLENIGNIGTTMGDETPIKLSLQIPQFTINSGVINGWSGIIDGEPIYGATTAFTSPIQGISNLLQNVLMEIGIQYLQTGGSGITIDNDGNPIEFDIEPSEFETSLYEDTEPEPKGEVTFVMPSGITLENFQTANGWEKIGEEDGRQKITLSLESLTAGEEFSFSVKVSWLYVLSQIWIYPTILISLIVWRVRARRKKKKRKKKMAAELNEMKTGPSKGGLSDADFASLSAGYDPTFGYDPSAPNSGDFDLYSDDYNWNQ